MAEHPACKRTGGSGKEYTCYIWDLPASFDKEQNGNYICSKKNAKGNWVSIYVLNTGDLRGSYALNKCKHCG